ncbi:hypothetical protein [Polyangium jinanense]|uniref:Uncharacterized protein n=1 Tax=Polyangium jinanense TaxID=2829994 RepID=A0A9X3X1X9_9BACT|nr:hypothetical protein [Polyangium jinanense]MDC3952262.1 hypothetical protein [Polyangium jinanense]MDC3956407.1 hypothetical protein [Polyangium jinanense]MDC3979891.1 hypothetical protein [Polyangium jinanense]MDC3982544.1 hypothetical protein [Polyangium jinanense]
MSERLPALDSGRAVVSKDDRSSGRSQNDVADMTRLSGSARPERLPTIDRYGRPAAAPE